MFDRLRLGIGLTYTRIRFRGQKDATTRFSSVLSRSQRALVIFPEQPLEMAVSHRLLEYVYRRFSASSTVFVVRDDLRSSLPSVIAERAQTYSPADVSSFFTPRGALIRKLQSSTFDVAFDLNRDFLLPSAFICKASNAPVRVSFVKNHADFFYNLQVKTREATNQYSAYNHLMRCLDMF